MNDEEALEILNKFSKHAYKCLFIAQAAPTLTDETYTAMECAITALTDKVNYQNSVRNLLDKRSKRIVKEDNWFYYVDDDKKIKVDITIWAGFDVANVAYGKEQECPGSGIKWLHDIGVISDPPYYHKGNPLKIRKIRKYKVNKFKKMEGIKKKILEVL